MHYDKMVTATKNGKITKNFFIPLSLKSRIRVRMEREGRRIVNFVVQLEHKMNDDWKEIVRYNYAHGFPHRDLILSNGSKRKERIHGEDLNEVFNFAVEDIKMNWERYLREAGYECE